MALRQNGRKCYFVPLQKLLMMKAAEDLKKQQMLKEQERQNILNDRIVPLPDLDSNGDGWGNDG